MTNSSFNKFQIRLMVPLDLPNVRELWEKVGFILSYSDTLPELKKMLQCNPDLCLVLEQTEMNDNIIGSVMGGFDGRRGWVHHLSIIPKLQGKSLGKKLMEELTNRFKKKGIAKLKLEILKSNSPVIEFYKKLGWNFRSDLITMSLTLKK